MKNHFVKLTALLAVLVMLVSGCGGKTAKPGGGKLTVYTTFYPLYDFTSKVVAEHGDVANLTPAGIEPHDFEPSPKQVAGIYSADVFIYLGPAMEPWAARMAESLSKKGVVVLEAGRGLVQDNDPHVWLDPVLAKQIARRIYETVARIDEAHRQEYEKNFTALSARFDELDSDYRRTLARVERRDIVTAHAAFGYLARRYGLNQVAISGLSPQAEPSPKQLAELASFCRERGVKYIFFETLSSPKFSETLARETGAKTLVLNPIGGLTNDQASAGEDYFSLMKQNLKTLEKALGVK